MSRDIFPSNFVPFVSEGGVALVLVKRKFCQDWFRCTFGVSSFLG